MRFRISNNVIAIVAILFMLLSISVNTIVIKTITFTGKTVQSGSGTLELCYNTPPTLSIGCAATATVDSAYTCDIDATDSDSGQTHTFADNTTLFDIGAATGIILFTPSSAATETIKINVTDDSSCTNNNGTGTFSLTISEAAAPPSPGGGAGGGGGGGICTSKWECGEWGPCIDGAQSRVCSDAKCNKKDRIESRICNFRLEPRILRIVLKTDEKTERPIVITNVGDSALSFNLELTGLENLIRLSESQFLLEPTQKKVITAEINAAGIQPGVYVGRILVKADSFYKEIDAVIEVESKLVIFDLSLDIPAAYRKVIPGNDVASQLTLFNLGSKEFKEVTIEYYIKDMEGKSILSEKEVIGVESQLSYEKRFTIPPETKPGDYVLYAVARFDNSFGTASELFQVIEPVKLAPPRDYTLLLLLMIAILLLIMVLLLYEHKKIRGFFVKEYISLKRKELMFREKIKWEKNKAEAIKKADKKRRKRLKTLEKKKKKLERQRKKEERKKARLLKRQEKREERKKRQEERGRLKEERKKARLLKKQEREKERILRREERKRTKSTEKEKAEKEREEKEKERLLEREREKRKKTGEKEKRVEKRKRIEKEIELIKKKRKGKTKKAIYKILHDAGLIKTKEEKEAIKREKGERKKEKEQLKLEREEKQRQWLLEREKIEKEKFEIKETEKAEKLRLKREREERTSEEKRVEKEEKIKRRKEKELEKQKREDERREIEEEKRKLAEKKKRLAKESEEKKKKAELLEKQRKADEHKKKEEAKRIEEEKKRLEEEKGRIEEQKKIEEERKREEQELKEKKLAEEQEKLRKEKEEQEQIKREEEKRNALKKKEKLEKQLQILEEGYKSEFISEEAYNKDKNKIIIEIKKIEAKI